jgi:hypothetical protein
VLGGVHVELIELYRSVAEQGLMDVIDSSFGALDCFERCEVRDVD